ncbi:class I SAM-dependent methyltransferase [Streptomyces achromogenes]|uniref:class I SAM-dependent methyltransferase n=1 Tax=Streptomyces achromogenes TaxID=67255 RepID=UPI0004CB7341|nr:class I SAM-dependent methyltransferase [Streptomyces achromogenes]
MSRTTTVPPCRICGGGLQEFFDFGKQPMANAYRTPGEPGEAFTFRLAGGICDRCTTVQLLEEAPHDRMFHGGYPYRSSGSSVMRSHFEQLADTFLATELDRPDPFIVELGSNDGIMLRKIAAAGVRHLGVEPCDDLAETGRRNGIRVCNEFFDEELGKRIREEDGPADVVFAANTFSHISFLDSVLRGIDALLAPHGVFVFEDPYFGDIVRKTSFDQIYDEHIFFFTVRSVKYMAAAHGFELVDAERLPVHGGEIRYTLARPGTRAVQPSVRTLLAEEEKAGLADPATLRRFSDDVRRVCTDLVSLLRALREDGRTVVGYGATAKSATLLNLCGIGPELLSYVCDTTPAKQGHLTPGTGIPIRSPRAFTEEFPDYALLLAWNHAEEIKSKESAFVASGGRWIEYVPDVRISAT